MRFMSQAHGRTNTPPLPTYDNPPPGGTARYDAPKAQPHPVIESSIRQRYAGGMIRITRTIAIDESEIKERFVRARGPGGQNINKVATAVQLRFDAARSPCLGDDVRERLVRLAGRRMTDAGLLIIEARRFRTRQRNRQDAMERLIRLVRRAAERPKPRRKTKPTFASKRRRLESKRQRGRTKHLRRAVSPDED